MKSDEAREKIAKVRNWYHRIEVHPGVVTPGTHDSPQAFQRLALPDDCSGLSVLDIGTRDGFFAFELERRGADVIAIDFVPPTVSGFRVASELLGSRVRYFKDNVYNLSVERYGTFDIVLFLGVLYHLPDPLGALDIIRRLCQGTLYLETHVLDENGLLMPDGTLCSLSSIAPGLEEVSILQFFPDDSLGGDLSNFFAPNMKCLIEMLRATGFTVQDHRRFENRAVLRCGVTGASAKARQLWLSRGVGPAT